MHYFTAYNSICISGVLCFRYVRCVMHVFTQTKSSNYRTFKLGSRKNNIKPLSSVWVAEIPSVIQPDMKPGEFQTRFAAPPPLRRSQSSFSHFHGETWQSAHQRIFRPSKNVSRIFNAETRSLLIILGGFGSFWYG